MEAYLDNCATTPCNKEVADEVMRLLTIEYGNPSSMHKMGFDAETIIRKSKRIFADIWRVSESEVLFTSGGTESDNTAIIGAAMAHMRRGKHIITTAIEHAAVSASCKYLEDMGFEITYLGTDENGIISLDELSDAIRDDTILVSIMHVNNEIGSIEPIEEAGEIIKKKNPKCLFHVDDIQGFGKLRLYPKKAKVDLISVSGHKIHGPKGTGALYIAKDVRIKPMILGGGQQDGMRSGTENVPGYYGMSLAAKLMYDSLDENYSHLKMLRERFISLVSNIDDVSVNCLEKACPHIVSLSVRGVRAEVLLHALEEKGVYVSAGSACSSNKPAVSQTLKAIGVDKNLLDSTVRVSFSVDSTMEEVEYAYETLSTLLPTLRRFTRKK